MPIARKAQIAAVIALAACGGAQGRPGAPPGQALVSPPGAQGRIEVRRLESRPHLALVAREGDPVPALVATVVTDLGPAATTALAAVVEARLGAAGVDAEIHVDRSAFRARLLLADATRAGAFFAALAGAMSRAVTAGGPEIALASQRLASLRRNPLDGPELVPIAACTGALGVAPNEAVPDLASEAGIRDLEAWRRSALQVGHASVAAVGPPAYCDAIARALEASSGWPVGAASADPWPTADATGVYTAPSLDRRSARVTIAARVADPHAAAAAADRLAAPDSPLAARLRALPEPWRVVEIAGVARPRGGCVSAAIELAAHPPGVPIEPEAALAAAILRSEVAAEIAAGGSALVAGTQILGATDPREAAARAAWWALAAPAAASPARWAIALGLPPAERPGPDPRDAAGARFAGELARVAAARGPSVERRSAVERGQGELWLLVASPCGVAEEGAQDAGFGALAVLAAVGASRRADGVAIEPWITSDGLGVIAHAAPRDDRESAADLARRVGGAAARVLAAPLLSPETIGSARSAVLDHFERSLGRRGAAFEVLAGAVAPDHPSWLEPLGVWGRVASAATDGVRARAQALAAGPLRVAVIANADAAQAAAAAFAVERWFSPSAGPRACHPSAASPARAGRYEAHAHADGTLAQGLIGAPAPPPGAAGRELVELTALALDGDGGLLAGALAQSAATGQARLSGGGRAPALLVDVRAPPDALGPAMVEVRSLLGRLSTAANEGDLARATRLAERRELAARVDPRRRLADLWADRKPAVAAKPTLAAWRAFLAGALKDSALVVVETRAE